MRLSILMVAVMCVIASVPGLCQEFQVQEFEVCTATEAQRAPCASGSLVCWQDKRAGNWDIVCFDLTTGKERRVTEDPGDEDYPAVCGNTMVWTAHGIVYGCVYGQEPLDVFEVDTGRHDHCTPDISGDLVVWLDDRNRRGRQDDSQPSTDYDIFGKRIGGGAAIAICTASEAQAFPAISGSTVVWEDFRNGPPPNVNHDIYGLDTATGQEFPVCTAPGGQAYPDVSGDVVVWQEMGGPTRQSGIRAYHVPSGQEAELHRASISHHSLAISGDLVVWAQRFEGQECVIGLSLSSRKKFLISRGPGERGWCDVHWDEEAGKGLVVWEDSRNGNKDIYAAWVTPQQ